MGRNRYIKFDGDIVDIIRTTAKKANTLRKYIFWRFENLQWQLPRNIRKHYIGCRNPLGITIAITTYIERFDDCFKPTLRRISELFPYEQIIVVANGHYDTKRQEIYLVKLRELCEKYTNLELIDFREPVSTCKMTNSYILKACHEKILFLNDDTDYSLSFRKEVLQSGILSEYFAIINGTWGISVRGKFVIRQVGFFDERLPEIGGEDDDYAARCAIAGIDIPYFRIRSVTGLSRKQKKRNILNSWGKNMKEQIGGYSTLNHVFLHFQKWETSDEPFEGATFVPNRTPKYWKLRPGMETPNFYPNESL